MKSKWLKWLLIIVVCGLIGGLWAMYDYYTKPAKQSIRDDVVRIVNEWPELKPMYDQAMSDGVLTLKEAKAIIDRANELRNGKK